MNSSSSTATTMLRSTTPTMSMYDAKKALAPRSSPPSAPRMLRAMPEYHASPVAI